MEPSKGLKAIQLAIIHIKNDNIKKLESILNAMPLDKLGDESDILLSTFLSTCSAYGRGEAAKIILSAWDVVYPEFEQIQLLSKLFMMNIIDDPTLAFLVSVHPDYTYVELMDDLMAADNSEEVVTACSRADVVFSSQPHATYDVVREHASELGNWRVEEYAIAKMEENAPFAPKPEWVGNYTDQPLVKESDMSVPKFELERFELPPDEEAVELLTAGLSQLGISISDIEQAKEALAERLATSTRTEKINLLKPIISNQAQKILAGDIALFRLFGPAHPLVNQDLTRPGKSNMYGGCRMFLCDVFDKNFDEDYVEDWFTGVCDSCHLRIAHRWYAVRKPRSHGGWIQCHCSFKCVRDSMVEYEEEPNLLVHELIDIFEKEINEIGIQDRLPN